MHQSLTQIDYNFEFGFYYEFEAAVLAYEITFWDLLPPGLSTTFFKAVSCH